MSAFGRVHNSAVSGSPRSTTISLKDYVFSRSDDGEVWSEVVSGAGANLGLQGREDIEFPPTTARYWKLEIFTNHADNRYQILQYAEFRTCAPLVIAVTSPPVTVPPVTLPPVTLPPVVDTCDDWAPPTDWNIEASSSFQGSQYSVDNIRTPGGSGWQNDCCFEDPAWLTFDAGHAVTMSAFGRVHNSAVSGSPRSTTISLKDYVFSRSDDGEVWSEVVSGAGANLGLQGREDIEFPPTTARYWKLEIFTNHADNRYQILQYVEFRICAVNEAAPPPAPPQLYPPPPAPAPPPTPVPPPPPAPVRCVGTHSRRWCPGGSRIGHYSGAGDCGTACASRGVPGCCAQERDPSRPGDDTGGDCYFSPGGTREHHEEPANIAMICQ